jgi:hypothetical protein
MAKLRLNTMETSLLRVALHHYAETGAPHIDTDEIEPVHILHGETRRRLARQMLKKIREFPEMEIREP